MNTFLDPDAVPLQLLRLVKQPPELVPCEVEQPLHLRLRPLEVLDAERVDGDLLYAQLVAPLQRLREPREAGGVALDLLDAGGACEPPVAVHDEGDVPRDGAAPQRPADRFW